MVKITLTQHSYTKVGGKYVLDSAYTSEISREHYDNYVTSMPFFRRLGGTERATRGYTVIGYTVIRLTSVSPDKSRKIVRAFSIEEVGN